MPAFALAFASTRRVYPWRDGQAELTSVAGYIPTEDGYPSQF